MLRNVIDYYFKMKVFFSFSSSNNNNNSDSDESDDIGIPEDIVYLFF